MIHERELEFRKQRFARIRTLMRQDPPAAVPDRGRYLGQLRAQIDDFLSIHELDVLREALTRFNSDRDFAHAFPGFGFGVRSFLDQLVEASPDIDELRKLLLVVLEVPVDDSEEAQIDKLVQHVQRVHSGGQPASKNAMTFLAFWWWVQDPKRWPCFWPDSERGLRNLGWLRVESAESGMGPASTYVRYVETVRSIHEDDDLVESVLAWAATHSLAPDSSICKRLEWAKQLDSQWVGHSYQAEMHEVARDNIAAVLADIRQFGDEVRQPVEDHIGKSLKSQLSPSRPDKSVNRYRTDAWVRWKLAESEGWSEVPSVMVHFSASGAAIGFAPGERQAGWAEAIRSSLVEVAPEGATSIYLGADTANQLFVTSTAADYLVGYNVAPEEIDSQTFIDEVVGAAAALQPVFDRAMSLTRVEVASRRPDLEVLRDLFLSETGYPSVANQREIAKQAEFLARLQPGELKSLTREQFRLISNSPKYGGTGNQSILNQTLRDSGDELDARLVLTLQYLLWGIDPSGTHTDDSLAIRIDRCLSDDQYRIKGLAETVVLKLLAVTDPGRFIPIFRVRGDLGKGVILDAFGLDRPSEALSLGEQQVQANDRLREVLEPLLPGDPFGQARFAYWAMDRLSGPQEDPLDSVVEDCYLPDRAFVDELVELLEDKRQIVLYGPPGTGKTFIARKLAEALAPATDQRRFVQFHPSTSYEDFFEGYRPVTDDSGSLSYRLAQGPFAQLADHAGEDARRHVLVIDELNRANVPKVFGELLFLLEYRDASVVPLYRQEGFELPENVWVIATMNTADRSIATLDQALRRRFHFVPVFPDDGPMAGLLDRYLETTGGDQTWAQLVRMVNGELRDRLGSGDQLIGPSHFLKKNLDEAAMERIWRYNVEPLMDDLFYGDHEAIQAFKWLSVLDRFREMSGSDSSGPAVGTTRGNGADSEGGTGMVAGSAESGELGDDGFSPQPGDAM